MNMTLSTAQSWPSNVWNIAHKSSFIVLNKILLMFESATVVIIFVLFKLKVILEIFYYSNFQTMEEDWIRALSLMLNLTFEYL